MEIKITIDGKEYSVEELRKLRSELDILLGKDETVPWIPEIPYIPWTQPVYPHQWPHVTTWDATDSSDKYFVKDVLEKLGGRN